MSAQAKVSEHARRAPSTVDEALAYVERVILQVPEDERTWSEISLVLLAAEVERLTSG